jgi:sporulation protein YlmC with PRC-barrel domain
MQAEQRPLRVSQLLGREVRDRGGQIVGRVADLHTERDSAGPELVTAAIVTGGRWGRLLGYERDEATGPWLLEKLAHYVVRRETRHVPIDELELDPPDR